MTAQGTNSRRVRTVGIERLTRPTGRRRSAVPKVSDADVTLVRRYGVLTPVPVYGEPGGPWEIVARERDWIAAQRAGLHEIPIVILDDLDPADLDRIAAGDGHVDPIAEAVSLKDRLERYEAERGRGALTALAIEIERTPSWICHRLRLLDLPVDIRHAVAVGVLSSGHGRALVRASDDEKRLRLATRAVEERWSVRRLEAAIRDDTAPSGLIADASVRGASSGPSSTSGTPTRSADVERLERHVGGVLGCPVTIDETAGTLVIDYRGSLDVLDGVLERLGAREKNGAWN